MFGNNRPRIGQELLDVPMGDMIRQMAFAIAEAQIVLDQNSIDVAEMMGGLKTITDSLGNVTFEDSRVYFGTEKIQKVDAITRHNSITSAQQKAEIRASLGANSYSPELVTTFTGVFEPGVSKIASGKYFDFGGVYYIGHGVDSGNPAATPVAYADLKIEAIGTQAPTTPVEIPRRISMLECGFTPTFYQFVDTIIEVKISIRYTQEGSTSSSSSFSNRSTAGRLKMGFGSVKVGGNVSTAQVNASYAQKYSYSAEGSSLLRTKLVPIPAPIVLEQRIQRMLEDEFDETKAGEA
ncbi:hypothetical protein D3C87_233040 [compost metagenome]